MIYPKLSLIGSLFGGGPEWITMFFWEPSSRSPRILSLKCQPLLSSSSPTASLPVVQSLSLNGCSKLTSTATVPGSPQRFPFPPFQSPLCRHFRDTLLGYLSHQRCRRLSDVRKSRGLSPDCSLALRPHLVRQWKDSFCAKVNLLVVCGGASPPD